jgi:hypothetical protein
MDLTAKWKLRVGVRQDFYDEVLNPLITVPGRFTNTGVPLIAGVYGQLVDHLHLLDRRHFGIQDWRRAELPRQDL